MKYILRLSLVSLLLVSCNFYLKSAPNLSASDSSKIFHIVNPDYKLSPQTGMTRQHWKDAALYLLKGAFSYIHSMDDPMKFPKLPGRSYPQKDAQVPTEKLEGLCRTLFIASPLLKENPELVINGIKVADYYRYQMGKLVDTTSASYIKPRPKKAGPNQNLVEFGALSISLFGAPEVLWNPLPQSQKDALAATMLSYGDGPTVPSNWKFFNIFIMSFFKSQGYPINEPLLKEYLQKTIEHYRGDGWYDDNPAFDYYSMWAFQFYGMLWSEYFGDKNYPEYAQKLRENFSPLKDNYPYMFSRNGEMIMWGRSISYRFGSVCPLPLTGFEKNTTVNYGWMRRISSGVILQFLQNPNFLKDSVPTLGFYGHFEPCIQTYSCRGSVYWSGKIFLGLLVPANNPFWTATENDGLWEKDLAKNKVYNKLESGSNILLTDYPNSGAAEIRSWCYWPNKTDNGQKKGGENYNRLAYNTAFPWQADGSNGEVSMAYLVKTKKNKWEDFHLYTFKKFDDGVYYREAELESNSNIKFQLADIPLANGILRVDRFNTTDTIDIRLGHYALPKLKGDIKKETRKVKAYEVQIIDNGEYQLAMVSLNGWEGMETLSTNGLHPASNESAVIDIFAKHKPSISNSGIYATLMLWKKSGEKWTNDELVPVKSLKIEDKGVTVKLTSGELIKVEY